MKETNEYLETSYNSIECLNYGEKLGADEMGKIIDIASKDGAIDHTEIRELTKIILKLKPEEVDASMQQKFHHILKKVKTQFA